REHASWRLGPTWTTHCSVAPARPASTWSSPAPGSSEIRSQRWRGSRTTCGARPMPARGATAGLPDAARPSAGSPGNGAGLAAVKAPMRCLVPRLEAASDDSGTVTFVGAAGDGAMVRWTELFEDAQGVAAAMQARGLGPGDPLARLGPTNRDARTR